MTDQAVNGNGGIPPQMIQEDPAKVTDALLRACRVSAEQSSTAQDTREMAEAAKAALAFAQAVVILDPTLGAGGVPLDHQLTLEKQRTQARARAAAPTPARSVKR